MIYSWAEKEETVENLLGQVQISGISFLGKECQRRRKLDREGQRRRKLSRGGGNWAEEEETGQRRAEKGREGGN